MQTRYRLFLDLDGVLADFDAGVVAATGKLPEALDPKRMWPALAKTAGFYENLPWLGDGKALWSFSRPFKPTILTGIPVGKWAEPQKRAWCARELGADVEVICCFSRDKARLADERLEMGEVMVLVDDRIKLQQPWEDSGGKFVLHTSAAASIAALQELGFA